MLSHCLLPLLVIFFFHPSSLSLSLSSLAGAMIHHSCSDDGGVGEKRGRIGAVYSGSRGDKPGRERIHTGEKKGKEVSFSHPLETLTEHSSNVVGGAVHKTKNGGNDPPTLQATKNLPFCELSLLQYYVRYIRAIPAR